MLRLQGIGGLEADAATLENLLAGPSVHRDGKGEWRRFPFYYTLLALLDVDHDAAREEMAYALPACRRRRRRLKPGAAMAMRRITVLDRVIERIA